ncbi:MAG: L,D-transpeptidase [Rhodospirillales bacterium]|nr:L,D-transpeptidase [Rhodospirillales bacterium]
MLIFEPSFLAAEQTNKSTRSPSITVEVSLSGQTMKVYQSGVATHEWLVSTARQGKVTPNGAWTAKWLSKNHKSSRYNNAPMPYSIFYNGNFAVHGTYQVDRLGSPASAGCIRLHPKNAAVLFALVDAAGLKNTTISVVN